MHQWFVQLAPFLRPFGKRHGDLLMAELRMRFSQQQLELHLSNLNQLNPSLFWALQIFEDTYFLFLHDQIFQVFYVKVIAREVQYELHLPSLPNQHLRLKIFIVRKLTYTFQKQLTLTVRIHWLCGIAYFFFKFVSIKKRFYIWICTNNLVETWSLISSLSIKNNI